MMLLQRATVLISKMPNLKPNELTRDEAHELWAFLNSDKKLSISKLRLKVNLAAECGVFVEQLDAVANGATLAQVLTMESSDSKGKKVEISSIVNLLTTVDENSKDWVIPLCHSLNINEAELVWRWALKERWRSIRNRMARWCKHNSGLDEEDIDVTTLIDIIYNESKIEITSDSLKDFNRLKVWKSSSPPQEFWFVGLCDTLVHLSSGIARERNGKLHGKFTPLLDEIDSCWSWCNNKLTEVEDRYHNIEQDISFSKYQKPLPISWGEVNTVLTEYPKGGFLILHDGEYYLYTNGTTRFIVQGLSHRNIKSTGHQITFGVKDIIDSIEVGTIELPILPFELEYALKKRMVNIYDTHSTTELNDLILVIKYSWLPEKGWTWVYEKVDEDLGIGDVDQYTDYILTTGEAFE